MSSDGKASPGFVAEARGLVKEYKSGGRVRALDGIDLQIRPGEIFGLLGPNGAGKTTFVKCLIGLLRPTKGAVTLFGRSPTDPDVRRKIGFAPEAPHFPEFLSAAEVMEFHGKLLGLSRGEIEEQKDRLLAEAELSDAPKRIRSFSKGMVRRLAVAQALLGKPQFMILDEPTADLDPLGRRDVRNKLEELRNAGVATLLNSHLLSEVERVCDRVAIVHKGKVLAVGDIEDLVPEGRDLETVFVDLVEMANVEMR
jgi:ABC-2 type transport system ATP-binding protein